MRIGVFGSSAIGHPPEVIERSRAVGREIALSGHTIVTGACPGLPHEAVLGAWEEAGMAVGYSPATDIEEHADAFGYPTEGFSEIFFIPAAYEHASDREVCRKYRNVSSVASVDAAIFIGGETGTMNEFTIAHDRGIPIGVLLGTGGISAGVVQALLGILSGPSPPVIFDEDPTALVAAVVGIAERGGRSRRRPQGTRP